MLGNQGKGNHMHRDLNMQSPGMLRRVLLLGTVLTVAITWQAECVQPVEQLTDVVYGTGLVVSHDGVPGTKALTLDIYRPQEYDAPDKMAMIIIHGGAFTGGRPRDMAGVSRYFAERGFVCFTISYRLAGDLAGTEPKDRLAAACADARSAIRWIRAHATEFGINPNTIGVIGHSAGAITALEIAITSPADLPNGARPVIAPANHPEQTSAVQASAAIAGVVFHPEFADPRDPPLLFLHGANDPVITLDRMETTRARCEAAGARCRLIVAKGAGHDPWNERYEGYDARPQVVAFFREELGKAQGTLPSPDGVVMTENVLLEPAFAPVDPADTFRLDVSGTTHGIVALDPSGGTYPAGTVVRATAVPDENRVFLAWVGDTREVRTPAHVSMTGNRKVSAVFVPAPDAPRHNLGLQDTPGGTISPDNQWTTYVEGDQITLTGWPAPGFRFAAWTGSLNGNLNPVELVMDAEKNIGARFERVLSVEPLTLSLPAEARDGAINVVAAKGTWNVSQFYERPWLSTDRTDEGIRLATTRNLTCYPRTALLWIASDQPDVPPVLAFVSQQDRPSPQARAPATKGPAVYNGKPGETGTLNWWPGNVGEPKYGLLETNAGGGFTVGCCRGTALGYLTVDGKTPLKIPDGNDYHIYAEWDLPGNPQAIADPGSGSPVPAYFYVGIDSGGINHTKLRFGLEWKDLGQGKEWVARVQRDSDQISASNANNGKTPSHVKLHVWKDCDGDTILRPGSAIVRGQFRLDDGPWQDFIFSDKRMPNYYPIEGMGHDGDADLVTFKVRGLGTENLHGIRVEGADVPNQP